MRPRTEMQWVERVTPAAAVALFQARALAARHGSGAIELAQLAEVLLSPEAGAEANRLHLTLRALGCARAPGVEQSESTGGVRASRLAGPSDALRAVLVDAVRLAELNSEREASTLHLYAALIDHDQAGHVPMPGLTTDLLLACAQRMAASGPADDITVAVDPDPRASTGGRPPTHVSREELHQRTSGKRSALMYSLYRETLPDGEHMNSSLGWSRVRHFTIAYVVQYAACLIAALALVAEVIGDHAYWKLALMLPVIAQPTMYSPWLLVPIRLAIALFVPPLAGAAMVVSCLALIVEVHSQLWLLRVSRGQPGLPVSATWRPYWRHSVRLGQELVQGNDHDAS